MSTATMNIGAATPWRLYDLTLVAEDRSTCRPSCAEMTDGGDTPIVLSKKELDEWGAYYKTPQSWYDQDFSGLT